MNNVMANMCHPTPDVHAVRQFNIDGIAHNPLDKQPLSRILTHKRVYILNSPLPMPTGSPSDPKIKALQASRTLHPRPDQVRHPLFAAGGFFDARDLVQVKYEALRAIQSDGHPLSQAARDFGLSRPTIYEAQALFVALGLEGLLPRKCGRKTAHKFTKEVLEYLQTTRAQEPSLSAKQLAHQIKQRFRVAVHPRSIERALARHQEKKGRLSLPPQNP